MFLLEHSLCIIWRMPISIFFYSQIILQYSNIFTGHLKKKRARGHFFLFPNIFLVFNIFTGHLQKKGACGHLQKKRALGHMGIFFYSQLFFQYSNIFSHLRALLWEGCVSEPRYSTTCTCITECRMNWDVRIFNDFTARMLMMKMIYPMHLDWFNPTTKFEKEF